MMLFILKMLLKFVAVLLVMALGFGLLDQQIRAADSFSHFRLHGLLALVIIALALALFRAWRWVSAGLIFACVLGFYTVKPLVTDVQTTTFANKMRLVQFNSLFKNPKPEVSANWILQQHADVVTLQEVSKQSGVIIDQLQSQLPYAVTCKFATVGGVAVVSRYPILQSGCEEGQGLVWIRIAAHGQEMTVASLHLHWPWPYRQWQHIERLTPALKNLVRPVILAGDFNAAPWSGAVHKIAEVTETKVATGIHLTLRMGPRPIGPVAFMPIDHVLLPDGFNVLSSSRGPAIGSDHHPVVVDFMF